MYLWWQPATEIIYLICTIKTQKRDVSMIKYWGCDWVPVCLGSTETQGRSHQTTSVFSRMWYLFKQRISCLYFNTWCVWLFKFVIELLRVQRGVAKALWISHQFCLMNSGIIPHKYPVTRPPNRILTYTLRLKIVLENGNGSLKWQCSVFCFGTSSRFG